jgi:hypothetical protein
MSSSQGSALKAALFAALPNVAALASPVLVCYGLPGKYQPDDIVAILDSEGDSVPATIGSPRSREETIRQTFTVSCYRGGDDQQTCTERAFTLMDAVVNYCRTTDPTVGGTVRSLLPDVSWALEETVEEQGRVSDLTFTLTFNARI